jgi:hypothetical protein
MHVIASAVVYLRTPTPTYPRTQIKKENQTTVKRNRNDVHATLTNVFLCLRVLRVRVCMCEGI